VIDHIEVRNANLLENNPTPVYLLSELQGYSLDSGIFSIYH